MYFSIREQMNIYNAACGWSSVTARRSAARAFDSTCSTVLQPGITHVTAGCCRHHARAQWAIGTPFGTSFLKFATSWKISCHSSWSCQELRTSVPANFESLLYLPLSSPLARGTRASTPRFCRMQESKIFPSGFRWTRLYTAWIAATPTSDARPGKGCRASC